MITFNNRLTATVLVLWWAASVVFVGALTQVQSVAPLLDALRHAVPAVQKYARTSGFEAATAGFYYFFVVSTPFVAPQYFRFTELKRPLSWAVKLILWLLIPIAAFFMIIGINVGPDGSRRTGLIHLLLTSSWFGSSFIFLLFCHCLLAAIACLAKDWVQRNKPDAGSTDTT